MFSLSAHAPCSYNNTNICSRCNKCRSCNYSTATTSSSIILTASSSTSCNNNIFNIIRVSSYKITYLI